MSASGRRFIACVPDLVTLAPSAYADQMPKLREFAELAFSRYLGVACCATS